MILYIIESRAGTGLLTENELSQVNNWPVGHHNNHGSHGSSVPWIVVERDGQNHNDLAVWPIAHGLGGRINVKWLKVV